MPSPSTQALHPKRPTLSPPSHTLTPSPISPPGLILTPRPQPPSPPPPGDLRRHPRVHRQYRLALGQVAAAAAADVRPAPPQAHDSTRLQPGLHTVAAWSTYGCRCDSLNRKKDANTLEILDRTYRDVNVLFVQAHCIYRVLCYTLHALRSNAAHCAHTHAPCMCRRRRQSSWPRPMPHRSAGAMRWSPPRHSTASTTRPEP